MFFHKQELQFSASPERPDAVYARKLQEVLGGQYGEITVAMQYMFQGWNMHVPGKYRDLVFGIGSEEFGHVEMLATMVARLLEGAPNDVTADAVKDPAVAAVMGGMNPQQAIVNGGGPVLTDSVGTGWNGKFIVASGNLLADFRANVAAEAQGRLQTARLYNMTDDPGVKKMLKFNLARDTAHQNMWLAAIEELQADGLEGDVAPTALFDEENQEHANTIWGLSDGTAARKGGWANRTAPDGTHELRYLVDPEPLGESTSAPPTDPKLYGTMDGQAGEGSAKGAGGQSAEPRHGRQDQGRSRLSTAAHGRSRQDCRLRHRTGIDESASPPNQGGMAVDGAGTRTPPPSSKTAVCPGTGAAAPASVRSNRGSAGQCPAQCGEPCLLHPPTHLRFRCHQFSTVEHTGDDVERGRHTRPEQPQRVLHTLVAERVQFPDIDVGRRQARQVGGARRGGVVVHVVSARCLPQQGPPAEKVGGAVPPGGIGELPGGRRGVAVVQHRIEQHLEDQSRTTAVARHQGGARCDPGPRASAADGQAFWVQAQFSGAVHRPQQPGVAVLYRCRVGALGRQPVVDGDGHAADVLGITAQHLVVGLGEAGDHPAAVDPVQAGQGAVRALGPVGPHTDIRGASWTGHPAIADLDPGMRLRQGEMQLSSLLTHRGQVIEGHRAEVAGHGRPQLDRCRQFGVDPLRPGHCATSGGSGRSATGGALPLCRYVAAVNPARQLKTVRICRSRTPNGQTLRGSRLELIKRPGTRLLPTGEHRSLWSSGHPGFP